MENKKDEDLRLSVLECSLDQAVLRTLQFYGEQIKKVRPRMSAKDFKDALIVAMDDVFGKD